MSRKKQKPSRENMAYIGNHKGSTWNKWDLHVHTPASVENSYSAGDTQQTWKRFIRELESLSPDIRILGINDYSILDGYIRLLTEKSRGRLKNIELLLPVIELRLSSFSGHSDLRKINYHIIFSNELSPDQIEAFLLRKLVVDLTLDDDTKWQGSIAHKDGLIELGKAIRAVTPEGKGTNQSDLELGFANAAIPFEQLQEALKETTLTGKHLKAVGLGEWDQMRWDGGSGAIKKNIINQSDLVLTCSPSPKKYQERKKQLTEQGVLNKLRGGRVCLDSRKLFISDKLSDVHAAISWASVAQ